jgi:hypothetical protein
MVSESAELDRTNSGSSTKENFGISGVEPSGLLPESYK